VTKTTLCDSELQTVKGADGWLAGGSQVASAQVTRTGFVGDSTRSISHRARRLDFHIRRSTQTGRAARSREARQLTGH